MTIVGVVQICIYHILYAFGVFIFNNDLNNKYEKSASTQATENATVQGSNDVFARANPYFLFL